MVGSVVGEDVVDGVVRELVTAVVKHGLDGGSGEEPHGLARSHAGKEKGKSSSECVKEEALEWVVIKSSISIGYVKTVVS